MNLYKFYNLYWNNALEGLSLFFYLFKKVGDVVITCAGRSMSNVMQYRGLSSDISEENGKILTNDYIVNGDLNNGDELYTIDTQEVYIYNKENETLVLQ